MGFLCRKSPSPFPIPPFLDGRRRRRCTGSRCARLLLLRRRQERSLKKSKSPQSVSQSSLRPSLPFTPQPICSVSFRGYAVLAAASIPFGVCTCAGKRKSVSSRGQHASTLFSIEDVGRKGAVKNRVERTTTCLL